MNSGMVIHEDRYEVQTSRSLGRGVTLYGNGEAVAVSYSSSTASRSVYLGKDILGSVKTSTTDGGALEDRYEYDVFGQPYAGNLDGIMNLGYMSKPYDSATGLYNYGFRDYKPQAARFTTVDPIRDGSNWFVYVNNDPVNWVDLWGLAAETVWDAISLATGIVSLGVNISNGNVRGIVVDSAGILADALALAVPFVPGGAGMTIKAVRIASAAKHAANAANVVDGVISIVEGTQDGNVKDVISGVATITSTAMGVGADKAFKAAGNAGTASSKIIGHSLSAGSAVISSASVANEAGLFNSPVPVQPPSSSQTQTGGGKNK